MFSRINRVKTDWRSGPSRNRLDVLLRISDDGPSIEEFNPDASIDCWYCDKVCRLNTGHHNYPSKHKKSSGDKGIAELETLELVQPWEQWKWRRCRFWLKNWVAIDAVCFVLV